MITDEQRETIRGSVEMMERFGMNPRNIDRLSGFTGLRLTEEMVIEALRDPEIEIPKETESMKADRRDNCINGVPVIQARVIPAPKGAPGRNEGYPWIPGLKHGDAVYHEKWMQLKFLRWDGGFCVCMHTREHLDPEAPEAYPRLGAIPAGSRIWVQPEELWVEEG